MFGRKTGFLAVVTTALLLLGGCGDDGTVTEEQARGWYNDMVNNRGVVNDTTGDGTGIYSGGPVTGDNAGDGMTRGNNGERNTYGMRTEGDLGDDIRNAWENVKDDLNNDGNDRNDNGNKNDNDNKNDNNNR